MDELKVMGQKPKPIVPFGHEQCIGLVGGASPTNGSLPNFNNTYSMVDVARANEEEAIAGMPKLGDRLEDGTKSIWPLRRPQ
jgi:hypothetical protein